MDSDWDKKGQLKLNSLKLCDIIIKVKYLELSERLTLSVAGILELQDPSPGATNLGEIPETQATWKKKDVSRRGIALYAEEKDMGEIGLVIKLRMAPKGCGNFLVSAFHVCHMPIKTVLL